MSDRRLANALDILTLLVFEALLIFCTGVLLAGTIQHQFPLGIVLVLAGVVCCVIFPMVWAKTRG